MIVNCQSCEVARAQLGQHGKTFDIIRMQRHCLAGTRSCDAIDDVVVAVMICAPTVNTHTYARTQTVFN